MLTHFLALRDGVQSHRRLSRALRAIHLKKKNTHMSRITRDMEFHETVTCVCDGMIGSLLTDFPNIGD